MPTQPRRRTRKPEGKQTAEHQSDQNDEPHTHTPSTPAAPVNEQGWCPSRSTTFKLFFTVRTCGAIWSIIMDCDETFNFWEPGHFLVYKHGFQTWEYSPLFALRSYAYLIPHVVIIFLSGRLWGADKVRVFYTARAILGLVSSWCEAYLYEGIVQRFGKNTGLMFLVMLSGSAGMFHSSCAFLPSTTAMYGVMLFFGALCRREHTKALVAACAVVWITWPFAGLIFVVPGIYMLWDASEHSMDKLPTAFTNYVSVIVTSSALFLTLSALLDCFFYGHFCLAVWNIIRYNVFGSSEEIGSELYGIEESTFYVKNLLLNFNFGLPLAAVGMFFCLLKSDKLASVLCTSAALWIFFMSTRPHKEERFMFPIYPLLCFAAASGVKDIGAIVGFVAKSHTVRRFFLVLFTLVYCLVGISRIIGLRLHYGAPLVAWEILSQTVKGNQIVKSFHSPLETGSMPNTTGARVCVGKEWYRFPNSFFLPDHVAPDIHHKRATVVTNDKASGRLELRFLRSGFRGQLPREFNGSFGTKGNVEGFNAYNREESTDRYVLPEQCDIIVDLMLPPHRYSEVDYGDSTDHPPPHAQEPWFHRLQRFKNGTMMNEEWVSVYRSKFLQADDTPSLHRAFYFPVGSREKKTFGWYHVLFRKNFARALLPDLFADEAVE